MRSALPLLGGQTLSLGLSMAFLAVPASSILLATYGAGALPYTYMGVAVAGVLVSWLMTRAQRRWSLGRVTISVLAIYTALVTAAWLALTLAGATWVTFPLIVLFPLAIPIGFVLVGTQAGKLLDVRQMKASFPKVVAGFSVGYAIGGLAAARLVGPLGGPENLLAVDALAALLFLAFAALTARRHPEHLLVRPEPAEPARQTRAEEPTSSTRALLRNRLVVLIFGYQVLSAIVTQLLDFMVWERSAARYPDPSDLARFLGMFGAVINVVSLAFVALVAGRLLTRYGVRLGLAANPGGVLVLLVLSAVVGYATGPASTAFFVLVCAQQVTDIALTDGTTRTSINATYQALPASMRVAAQTRVEGVGVPLAIGLTGAFLLVLNALDIGVVTLVVITLGLTVVWLWLAFAAYGDYGRNLRTTLTRRAWDPVALRLDDQSRAAVEHLVRAGDLRDLRLGLDVLADTDDPALPALVGTALRDPDPDRRMVAVSAAAHAWRTSVVNDWVPGAVQPLVRDPDAGIRTAAELALAGMGGVYERGEAIRLWAQDLVAADPERRDRALAGAAVVPDPAFAPGLLALAADPQPPSGLADALAANADSLIPATQAALAGTAPLPWSTLRLLVGALGAGGSSEARAVLIGEVGHGDPRVADAVLDALVAGGQLAAVQGPRVDAAVKEEAERMGRALGALAVLADEGSPEHVIRGLNDEVGRSRRRATALLGLKHDPVPLSRTVGLLESEGGERPLALETLEVTVGRAAFPTVLTLLDPTLEPATRLERLERQGSVRRPADATTALVDLIEDEAGEWRDPWLRACALHALAAHEPARARTLAAGFVSDADPVTAETAAWILRGRGVR